MLHLFYSYRYLEFIGHYIVKLHVYQYNEQFSPQYKLNFFLRAVHLLF